MKYYQTFLSDRSDGRLSDIFVEKYKRHGPYFLFWKKAEGDN